MENQSQNELYFAVQLAVVVTALLLTYKHTDQSWSSSLCHQHSLPCLSPANVLLILYRAKKCETVFSPLSYENSYEHIHLTKRGKRLTQVDLHKLNHLVIQWMSSSEGTMQEFPMLPLGYRKSCQQYLDIFAWEFFLAYSPVLCLFY